MKKQSFVLCMLLMGIGALPAFAERISAPAAPKPSYSINLQGIQYQQPFQTKIHVSSDVAVDEGKIIFTAFDPATGESVDSKSINFSSGTIAYELSQGEEKDLDETITVLQEGRFVVKIENVQGLKEEREEIVFNVARGVVSVEKGNQVLSQSKYSAPVASVQKEVPAPQVVEEPTPTEDSQPVAEEAAPVETPQEEPANTETLNAEGNL